MGFVKMCCPNLSVLNRWFLVPDAEADDDSPFLAPSLFPPGRAEAACGRVKVDVVALGIVV